MWLHGFTIKMSKKRIIFEGSLAKYWNQGNNIEPLAMEDVWDVLNELTEKFGVSFFAAKVTRLDIAGIVVTDHAFHNYTRCLGAKSNCRRWWVDTTLYYDNSEDPKDTTKQLIVYDKHKEAEYKGMQIPEPFVGKNLFRYELRIKKDLKNQLQKDVIGKTLYQPYFFRQLVTMWMTSSSPLC